MHLVQFQFLETAYLQVSSKDLFQTAITKSMRLEEFEQTQNQSCMQVQSYLKVISYNNSGF